MNQSLLSAGRDWLSLGWSRFKQLLREVRADRRLVAIIGALLAIDLCWTLWYGVAKLLDLTETNTSLYEIRNLRITTEGGYPEVYNYAKILVLVLLLAYLARSTRQLIYVALTVVYAVVLADDSLAIHEHLGKYLVKTLKIHSMLGTRAQDIGEVSVWAVLGAILLPLLVAGLARSSRAHAANGLALLFSFGALVFCAFFVDQSYSYLKDVFYGSGILVDMLEDGGEMIAVTAACALAAVLVKQASQADGAPGVAALWMEVRTALAGLVSPPAETSSVDAAPDASKGVHTAQAGRLSRRETVLGCVIFALLGVATMFYLNDFVVTDRSKFHGDLTQSPHWVAYHQDAFADDDLLREYGSFNESPVQNVIYWLGTWFVDIVPLNKLVAMAIFGLTAALFFALVSSLSGRTAGVLASLFFLIFPRAAYEIAGGFSKAWAIGFVLAGVYVVETRAWRVLWWLMPLAAVTYPMASVLLGAIVLVALILELPRTIGEALPGLRGLAGGSALALVPLVYKYFTPPARIGDMISTEVMKTKWRIGVSSEGTLPLWEEVLSYLEHPFFILATIALLMLLCRRGLVWKRSWSALVIASTICFFAADLVAPRLYLPDRYTRYSIAALLILWNAHNWGRVLDVFKNRWVRRGVMAALVIVAALWFPDTFKRCDGEKKLGRWEDHGTLAPVSRAIASLPQPVLVAGHPYDLGAVMVQSRRPVLVIHRMFHHWFDEYRQIIDTRIRDTFRAIYARNERDVNRLAAEHGVTHLILPKKSYRVSLLRSGRTYRREYRKFIVDLAKGRSRFVLYPPPKDAVVFEDAHFWLVRLPLTEQEPSGDVPAGQVTNPFRERQR